jgi:hypothetical protein
VSSWIVFADAVICDLNDAIKKYMVPNHYVTTSVTLYLFELVIFMFLLGNPLDMRNSKNSSYHR